MSIDTELRPSEQQRRAPTGAARAERPLLARYRWELALAALLAGVLVFLVARNHALYPVVFADEMLYSQFARLMPLAEVTIPSYLYFALMGLSNSCGDGFLGCVRLMNALLMVGAGPFIYLSARHYCSKPVSLLIVLLCLLGPMNSFTLYFMPETAYYFAFAVLSWVALTRTGWHWATFSLVTGVLLGLMTMVKVHALFLVPALALYVAYVTYTRTDRAHGLALALAAALLATGAALATKFGVGYAIAGKDGLQVFGGFYGTQAEHSAQRTILRFIDPALHVLRGHLMAMSVLFGIPMVMLLYTVCSSKVRAEAGVRVTGMRLFTFLTLGAAFAMTVVYTASIFEFGPHEVTRLHMRYYDFTFPLLLLVVGAALGKPQEAGPAVLRWVLAAAVVAGVLAALVLLKQHTLSLIDGPEIAAAPITTTPGKALALLGAALVLAWAWRARQLALWLYLLALVPMLTIAYNMRISEFHKNYIHPGAFDEAGIFARARIPVAERGDTMVAGTGLGELMRTKMYMDNRDVTLLDMPEGAPFELTNLPVRKKWLLVVGPHELPPQLKPVLQHGRYALVDVGMRHRPIAAVELSNDNYGALLAGVDGMSVAEPWGRWSNSKTITLRFAKPLPRQATMVLKVQAFGPNAGARFVARVGNAEQVFTVMTPPSEVFLQFATDGAQDRMTIEIPQPVSPASLGISPDERELGLGILSIELGSAPD